MAKPLTMRLVPKLSFEFESGGTKHVMEVEAYMDRVYKLRDPWTKEVALVHLVERPDKGPLARAHEEVFDSIMRGDTVYEVEVLSISPTLLMEVRAREQECPQTTS